MKMELTLFDSVSSITSATSDYELNEWHHALLKFNGGNLLFYLNSALISNETVNANSLSNATEPLWLATGTEGMTLLTKPSTVPSTTSVSTIVPCQKRK